MERRSPVIVNLGLGSFHVSIELDACQVRKRWERKREKRRRERTRNGKT